MAGFCVCGWGAQDSPDDFYALMAYLQDETKPGTAGCSQAGEYLAAGTKADVHVTQAVQNVWAARAQTQLDDIVWTYVGTATGLMVAWAYAGLAVSSR